MFDSFEAYDIAKEYGPEFDTETIMKKLQENRKRV